MEHQSIPRNAPPPEEQIETPVSQWAQAVDTQQELQLLRDTIARIKGLQ